MSLISPQELTQVSDWGEQGQIGLANLNAVYGGPSGRGSVMSRVLPTHKQLEV
ncbi:hypothetical protein [Pectobacterium punjabense]|uniref:hypothetical protein n=1 Tax=Pectobacterium punjabense TaxID=2108399 RepID=UPI001F2AAE26|nr:hypothetical protein [Pectobacterium punjabense]MDG0797213.1 hypothetical protein [Pectobacterium punjabense]